MVQADIRLLGKKVESLVIEFDQEKFEKFLSSGSASPKAMRQYRKVFSETCFRISSEITPEVARTTAHNAKGCLIGSKKCIFITTFTIIFPYLFL